MLFEAKHLLTKIALSASVALSLAACTVPPLETPRSGASSQSAGISFASPETRLDQKLRNALIDLQGRSDEAANVQLTVSVSKQGTDSATERGTGEARIGKVTLTANYTITNQTDGTVIAQGKQIATASYDRSTSQVYANDRAEDDAETRAAQQLALKLRPVINKAKSAAIPKT